MSRVVPFIVHDCCCCCWYFSHIIWPEPPHYDDDDVGSSRSDPVRVQHSASPGYVFDILKARWKLYILTTSDEPYKCTTPGFIYKTPHLLSSWFLIECQFICFREVGKQGKNDARVFILMPLNFNYLVLFILWLSSISLSSNHVNKISVELIEPPSLVCNFL